MFVIYAVYYRYITTAIIDEKEQLRADGNERRAESSDIDG